MGRPSPKAPNPIRIAWWSKLVSRVWGTLSEASILIWQMMLDVSILILRKPWAAVTEGVVILYRVVYLICEHVIRLILLSSVKWEGAFVISCIAVSFDPLFFYIPIIDETNKCLAVDDKLRTTAVVLRLLTDIPLTVHFIAQLCGKVDTDHPNLSDSDSDHSNSDSESDGSRDSDFETTACSLKSVKCGIARRMPRLSVSVVINFLAVLPITQVVIIIGFFRRRSSSGTVVFLQRTLLNVSLVLQYVPRVCQIYLSSQHFTMGGIWIKPSLNLFLYIIASHVFAAFWYFFAIEREISCWHQACRNTPGCVANFDCGGIGNASTNLTAINQLCPINSPNTTIFDFGIYLPILQSGNTGAVNFLRKLFYSLWWGLRNLSNFGTNLETSSYMWENCFAILICISGLLLFLYLIGNLQKYMELATIKSLKSEQSRRKKITEKKKQIKAWMSSHDVSVMSRDDDVVNVRKRIKKYIKQHHIWQKDIKAEVDLKYFLADNRFPMYRIREPLMEYLVKDAAKSVLMLKWMDEEGWKRLCKYMKPVIYREEHIIKKAGQKLLEMIFIVQGEIECTNTMITQSNHLKKGDCYDIRLQNWAAMNYNKSYYDPLPTSTGRVRCQTKVEAFELQAFDLLRFVQQNLKNLHPRYEWLLQQLAVAHHNSTHHPIGPIHNQDDVKPWECPKLGLVKLNVTVVWDSDSKKAKMGCVCRDDRGEFVIAGNCSTSPFNDAFLANAWGMAKAIEFCDRQRVKLQAGVGIVVESDNQDLIDCLNLPVASNERISEILLPVLESIETFASKFKTRYYMYCNRQSNTVANLLAERAVDITGQLLIRRTYSTVVRSVHCRRTEGPNVSAFCEAPPWLEFALNKDRGVISEHNYADLSLV